MGNLGMLGRTEQIVLSEEMTVRMVVTRMHRTRQL